MHLIPDKASTAISTCALSRAGSNTAGVKIVGDYVDNYKRGLPSELALLNLFDPRHRHAACAARRDGDHDMRTGAVTASRQVSRTQGQPVSRHIGARGTAYWNVRLLDDIFSILAEIRVHSRRKEVATPFGATLSVISARRWS